METRIDGFGRVLIPRKIRDGLGPNRGAVRRDRESRARELLGE